MKRFLPFLLLGILLAFAAYSATYYSATSKVRCLMNDREPELAWLKTEFSLDAVEFDRIRKLHEGYRPICAEMCRQIGAKNTEIRGLLAKSPVVTPEVEQKMAEAGALRVECQKRMLRHFLAVSEAMPAAQRERYLAWVERSAFCSMSRMDDRSCPACRDEH